MRSMIVTLVSVAVLATTGARIPAYAGLPPAHPGPTVNDYTAAESARAEAAAQRAGYTNLEMTMVQDGNFFFRGQKAGQTHSLTVTPDGTVYPSSPAPSVAG